MSTHYCPRRGILDWWVCRQLYQPHELSVDPPDRGIQTGGKQCGYISGEYSTLCFHICGSKKPSFTKGSVASTRSSVHGQQAKLQSLKCTMSATVCTTACTAVGATNVFPTVRNNRTRASFSSTVVRPFPAVSQCTRVH